MVAADAKVPSSRELNAKVPRMILPTPTAMLALLVGCNALKLPVLPKAPQPPQPPQPLALLPALAAASALLPPLPAFAEDPSFLDSPEVHQLGIYFAQTLISWGVPAAVLGVIAIKIASAAGGGGGGGDDEPSLPPALAKALGQSGEPKEYLTIERLNSKLQSFEYSFEKASVSKASALRTRGSQELERKFGNELAAFGLDSETVEQVFKAAKSYRRTEEKVTKKLDKALIELRASGLKKKKGSKSKLGEMEDDDDEAEEHASADEDDEEDDEGLLSKLPNPFASMDMDMPGMGQSKAAENKRLLKAIGELSAARLELEVDFLQRLSEILTKEQADALAAVLKPSTPGQDGPGKKRGMMGGDAADGDNESGIPRLGGRLDALSALVTAAAEAAGKAKHVYVLKFFGDVTASQVAQLRQEVTAVLRSADAEGRGDEVVLVLNTGGGTVTGYGLAAAQLQRLKGAGLHLTVCVEQVAASGGYMMACTADKIVASPFAVVGSIGVITEQPNVFERLEKEGVKFSTVTAGKYKRTLTPTKKLDPKDLAKLEDDIAQILKLFKGFVAENRPQLDIEKVATGETWFGPDALERKLVDHLATVDDVLLEHVDAGSQVYGVTYTEKPKSPLAALGLPGGAAAAPLQALALDALTRAAGAGGAAGPGALLSEAQALLRSGGGATPMLRRADEPEPMAARPTDAAEPMARWEGDDTPDSWHL